MQDCGGEFADGGVVQRDFQALMESHIAAWSANVESYKIKQPVRNIGLQVGNRACIPKYKLLKISASYFAT